MSGGDPQVIHGGGTYPAPSTPSAHRNRWNGGDSTTSPVTYKPSMSVSSTLWNGQLDKCKTLRARIFERKRPELEVCSERRVFPSPRLPGRRSWSREPRSRLVRPRWGESSCLLLRRQVRFRRSCERGWRHRQSHAVPALARLATASVPFQTGNPHVNPERGQQRIPLTVSYPTLLFIVQMSLGGRFSPKEK